MLDTKEVEKIDSINWYVVMWQASLIISCLTFFNGLFKRSSKSMGISCITCILIALYFLGANNEYRLIFLILVILFIITIIFHKNEKVKKDR